MKKETKIWFIVGVVFVITVLIQIYANNVLAGKGENLAYFEGRMQEVKRENLLLRQELALSSSLRIIEKESQSLGLVKPDAIIYAETSLTAGLAPAFLGALR